MNHDIYICYDKKDEKYGDALYNIFEKNNINPWIKSKYMGEGDHVDKITSAIADSKCFVLILSKNSKNTNYVITETDIAFSKDIPIIVFNIDETRSDGNLEFILETQKNISVAPNSKKQLETLVNETSKYVKKPITKVNVDAGYVKLFEKWNPKKYVVLAIPLVIAVILIYFFVIVPTGQHTTDDGIFSMNVTDVDVSGSGGSYKYTIHGESYNLPADSGRYFMNFKFFDKNDKMVYEVNSTADEFKSGIMWSGDLKTNNVTYIGFKLTDINNKILSKQNYTIV